MSNFRGCGSECSLGGLIAGGVELYVGGVELYVGGVELYVVGWCC